MGYPKEYTNYNTTQRAINPPILIVYIADIETSPQLLNDLHLSSLQ